ncbi:hypothetical protein V1477_005555, partial [Vespula maculifrons]
VLLVLHGDLQIPISLTSIKTKDTLLVSNGTGYSDVSNSSLGREEHRLSVRKVGKIDLCRTDAKVGLCQIEEEEEEEEEGRRRRRRRRRMVVEDGDVEGWPKGGVARRWIREDRRKLDPAVNRITRPVEDNDIYACQVYDVWST